jgi:hypothetical protein
MSVILHIILSILLFSYSILLLLLSRPEQDEALGRLGRIM